MATLEKQLASSTLSKQCRVDLRNHVSEIETNSKQLSKKPVTLPDPGLPSAVTTLTDNTVKRCKPYPTLSGESQQALTYSTRKGEKDDLLASRTTAGLNPSGTYFKDCSHQFVVGARSSKDPFHASRSRAELSGKDVDFVYRYAEAATGTALARPEPADEASVAATEAYKEAFRKYKGRDPNASELLEAGRLTFAFDENGSVGVIQKPHSCHPHKHISATKKHVTACPNQVYAQEVPPARAARSEFPGPIPTWSTTKRTTTMTTNGTYQPGYHQPTTLKRDAVNTVVGSH